MQHPLLYQLNCRVYLRERSQALGRQAFFHDIPESILEQMERSGFEWLYLLGVWQTGERGRAVSRSSAALQDAYKVCLADLKQEDIIGSPFAVQAYTANPQYGGDEALARFRDRLQRHGLKLMLDFVPNHLAPDHPWISTNPERFIPGSQEDHAREPRNWGRFETAAGPRIFAYGRDPYFPGWPDTIQLNYRHAGCREAMLQELLRVAARCEGVRCDMAMLIEPDVFQRTWGDRSRPSDGSQPADRPFWPEAIQRVHDRFGQFTFMAEVYWDLEWRLQQRGFDFTYDKRLYDRLHAGLGRESREHLQADPSFQNHSARFLENHDEPRAASAFPWEMHRPAAIVTYLVPGLRFFQEGQFEGRKTCVSMHLGRGPTEPLQPQIRTFYEQLLNCLRRPELHDGGFRLWEPRSAWDGNWTCNQIIVFSWEQPPDRRLLAVVNYGSSQAQCYVTLGLSGLQGKKFTLVDLMGEARYERDGSGLAGNGLYLDLAPWGYHLFDLQEMKVTPQKPAGQIPAAKKQAVMAR